MTRVRVQNPAEFTVVVLLVGIGGLLAWDTVTAPADSMQRGPVGPRTMPLLVAGLLLLCAIVLAAEIVRKAGRPGSDGDTETASNFKTWTAVVGSILLTAVVVDFAGWVLAGGLMFYLCVYAFGSRHYIRDLVVAAGLAVGSFYLFYSGLGIALPVGVLKGVL